MNLSTLKKIALASSVMVLALSWVTFKSPSYTFAAARTNPSLQKVFDTEICPALMSIRGQTLSKYCKDYTYQQDLDNAEAKICNKYGSNQLKAQCQAYAAVKAGTAPTVVHTCSASGCDLIATYINPAINLLSVMFGLIAAASLIMGGIQYSASEGDPQKASRAKDRLTNTVIAIVAYSLLYGFLQFLVPGGFLNG